MTTTVSPLPQDKNGRPIQGGIAAHVFTVALSGSYAAITIPTGQECKSVLLKMQDGTEFRFSHTNTPTVPYVPTTGIGFDVVANAGTTIGYAFHASGTLSVTLLK